MSAENDSEPAKTGFYERSVQKITEWAKPYLHRVTQRFVAKSVDTYAKDNPRFARMIEFEVRRRGDGAGLTQDVAEPLLWVGVKTSAAVAIAVLTKSLENGKLKLVGYATAVGLVLNNAVELLRLVPRYKAGLQGSLEMAKDRWKSIEETGVDPFNQQSREINVADTSKPHFAQTVQKKSPVASVSLMEQAQKDAQQGMSPGIK
jgi:hypothetical protein